MELVQTCRLIFVYMCESALQMMLKITSNNIGLRPGLQNSGNLGNITITPPISGSGINSDKI